MAYRTERIEKIIERELSSILLIESKNPLLKFVSITKVAVSADMSQATIWFTVRGSVDETKATISALESSSGFLRTELAKRLDIKKVPELRFKRDESLDYGKKIEDILKNLK